MRRSSALLLVALVGLLLLPGAALAETATETATDTATAADEPAAGALLLAVDDAPAGPNPAPRDAEENPARDLGDYADRETPFTWAAAWLLAGLGFVGLAVMLAVYRFRVLGPQKDRSSA